MKEVVPAWGIETYTNITPFDRFRDNNRVYIDGKVFDTYIPCDFANETQLAGGLGMMEQVIFTETDEKPLPKELKDGTMCVSDALVVLVAGKEHLL